MSMYSYFDLLQNVPGVKHCISMRDSREELDFSLAFHTGENKDLVAANRRILQETFGGNAFFVSMNQVHGDRIVKIDKTDSYGWHSDDKVFDADAAVSDIPNTVLTVMTADCVPILLYDLQKRAIGAVHAGWKGSAKKITAKTVEVMKREYGSDPADIIAVIGPSIGPCCYEVDAETVRNFDTYKDYVRKKENGKYMLDLKSINSDQLESEGIFKKNIQISPVCTSCSNENFFSYRAEGGLCRGRFMSCIMLCGD